MSILSDRQIKARCMKPTHYYCNDAGVWGPAIAGITHPAEQLDAWERRNWHRSMLATDKVIAQHGWKPMITPFSPVAVKTKLVRDCEQKIISWGVSSYGYDVRLAKEDIKIFSNINSTIVDPMRMDERSYVLADILFDEEFELHFYIQPPKSVALGHTMEYFCIPRDLLVTCLGKSTYARVGIAPIVTPLEPEWEGNLVLEMVNNTDLPQRVYLETGAAQLIFNKADEVCEVSYADRGGKYQGQTRTQDALI